MPLNLNSFTKRSIAFVISLLFATPVSLLFATPVLVAVLAAPKPKIDSISPTSVTAGGPAFTVTVNGSNFVSNSVVQFNSSNRITTFVSATQLTAQITAADIVSSGSFNVRVVNPNPGGGNSNAIKLLVNAPVPTLSTIAPSSASAGGPVFILTATGSNFVAGSVVRFNGSNRTTTFVNSTQLTAKITATDIASAGVFPITVFNPAPGGGISGAVNFTVNGANTPVPTLSTILPSSASAGGPGFTLTANGANFVTGSVVRFNGSDRATTFVNSTQLTAQITAANIASAGVFPITVFNPAPGGGTSAAVNLTVNVVNSPVPTLSTIAPSSASAGGPGFTLTANGSNFVAGAVVRFNGSDRATAFVNSTQLTAQITATDIASAGVFPITVFNPAPGGGTSAAVNLTVNVVNGPVPTLSTISPSSASAGGPGFTLTATGTNFVTGSVVRFNGSDRATTFVKSTQLKAQITAADIANGGTFPVTIFNPAGTSNAINFTVNNPVPTLTTLSPTSKVAGDPEFTLTVTGTNFVGGSTVRFNGSARSTTFVNSTQLTAQITAVDIANSGTFPVTIFNPAPAGGASNAITLTVNSPIPTLTTLSPTSKVAGEAAFTLTVNGTNFTNGSTVRFNGSARATTFVNSTQLSAQITAVDLATGGTFPITVFNPAPGGGTSTAVNFTVNNPVPTLFSISPSSVLAEGPAFTLTASGTDFVAGAVVRFNGSDRTTTFVNSTQLTAQITAADLASGGTFPVTIFNPAPGGGTSNAVDITVNNPVPTVTTLSPTSKVAGDPEFILTVTGTNFISGSTVQFNGSARTTTFVNSTQLTAQITAADLAIAGTFPITIFNLAPGGGTSTAFNFTVNNPAPTLTTLSPTSKFAGDPAFTLTVTGTNFVSGSMVQFNGNARTTTFVSTTQLTAQILASDISAIGTFAITVFNPLPGGGTSAAVDLSVLAVPVPTITAPLLPASVPVALDFQLTVNGTGFVFGSVVRINGIARTTTFVSSTQLTATILAADIAAIGTYPITVFNPAPGGGISNSVNLTVNPSITTISPSTVRAGDTGFTLTVNGTGFVVGTVVRLNGIAKSTTFISSTQVAASITAADIATVGSYPVTVLTPAPTNLTSNAVNLSAIPSILNLTPLSAVFGGGSFTLTVNGAGFVNGSVIQWNGVAKTTTFVNATRLTSTIAAADIATVGPRIVTVLNPAPTNLASNPITFQVTSVPPATECPSGLDVNAANPGLINSGPARAQMWRTDDGMWWGAFSDNLGGIYFYKRSTPTTWNKGALIDTFSVAGTFVAGSPDCLWTGTNLFILIQETVSLARLYKYTYNSITQNYTAVAGFPVNIPLVGVGTNDAGKIYGTLAIQQDSSGKLWAAYAGGGIGGDGNVRVIYSTSADHLTWNTTGVVLASGLSDQKREGTAIVNFAGKIGVAWSNVVGSENAFRFHVDGALETDWSVKEVIDSGLGPEGTGSVAGKQMSMKAHPDGRIFFVCDDNDGLNSHLHLYIRSVAGVWGNKTLVVNNFSAMPSKGLLLLDIDNSIVHVIYKDGQVTTNGLMGQTFITQASMNNPAFNTPCLILDTADDGTGITTSNPTSSKQNLNATTDLVIAGSTGRGGNRIISNIVDLTPPVLTIFSISPAEVTAGEASFTLTVTGKLFQSTSTVSLNGTTTGISNVQFVNSGKMTATVASTRITTAGTLPVTVRNTTPTTVDSNAKNLVVTATNPVPTLGLITPNRSVVGSPQFTMTLHGTGFRRSSVVRLNGVNKTTQYVSDTTLTATIPATDMATAGAKPVTVFNATPGGGTSVPTNVTTFYVQPSCSVPAGTNIPGITLFNTVKSQMWYNDSLWWGAFSDNVGGLYFYKQSGTTYLKGALIDSNFNGRPDVLWNGNNLFILVYEFNTLAKLYKYTYNTTTDTYALITGFPININLTGIGAGVSAAETGSITIAEDSTGKLWAAYPGSFIGGDGNYRVIWSTTADHKTWDATGFIFDTGGSVDTQEVAPIVHFGGNKIGIVYSKQPTKEVLFRYHNDGDPETTWSVKEVADSGLGHAGGGGVADNHMSLRAAPDGRLFLAAKDSDLPNGYINLYVRSAAGVWSEPSLVDVDPHAAVTRPILLLDLENSEAYVYYADATSGYLYMNKANMNNPVFAPACPAVNMLGVSDVTSTKQNLKASMGLRAIGSTGGPTSALFQNPITLVAGSGNLPSLSSLSPAGVGMGSGPVTLTVAGSNFANGAIVYFNGIDRPTTFVNSTQLTVTLMATDLAALGTYPITVMNPKGGTSAAVNLTINPNINSLSPSTAIAGGPGFSLTVNGAGFVSGALVKFNNQIRTTSFISSTQLTAQILASDLAAAGPQLVTVTNPSGGTSPPSSFTVNNPAPTVSASAPTRVLVGGGPFTITVNGSNFNNGSVVNLNGQPRTTTFVSDTQLTAQILAGDIGTTGSFTLTVFNAAPGGGTSLPLSVDVVNPVPTLSSLLPSNKTAGDGAFVLTVNGTNFNGSSVVQLNGQNRETTLVNSTQLTAQISATDVQAAGVYPITVLNPLPGGGLSSAINLNVSNPLPILTGIQPSSKFAGEAAFVLTVSGSNFNTSSIVQWNGLDRVTSYVNSTQLIAQIAAADIAAVGIASVSVHNPAPGGGTSSPATFAIKYNPRQMRINNTSAAAGSTVSLPVELDAQGNENALTFSVSFDSSLLSNPQAALGSDAVGGTLHTNTTEVAQGRYGIALSLPSGQTFAPGTRQILILTFTLASAGTEVTTGISFCDLPIPFQVFGPDAESLVTNTTPGSVTITTGYEGDVAPRNSEGNNFVGIADWVQVSRFSAGLDTVKPGREFQRADCAPKSSFGNGVISISDWVQTGRYAAGMDPLVGATGPTGPTTAAPQTADISTAAPQTADIKSSSDRSASEMLLQSAPQTTISFLPTGLPAGQNTVVSIQLDALGNENALGFSFSFDPAKLSFVSAENGSDAQLTIRVNTLEAAKGSVGIALALPPGEHFSVGAQQILSLTFAVASGVNDATLPRFSDEPIAREVVDVNANTLKAVFVDASAQIDHQSENGYLMLQNYLKYLMHSPYAAAIDYWIPQKAECGMNAACIRQQRRELRAASLIAHGSQRTGYTIFPLGRPFYSPP